MLMIGRSGRFESGSTTFRPAHNVVVGTVKSWVNRAWSKLASLLDLTSGAELGPDDVSKAALATG